MIPALLGFSLGAALAIAPGCVTYRPQPLDERALLNELQAIRLESVRRDAASTAEARSAPDDPASALTQEEAVAVALFQNPALRAVRKERGVAEGELISAGLLANPSLEASWLHIEDFTRSFASGLIGLGADWTPPRPGELDAKKRLGRARLDQVAAEISTVEWRVATDVRRAHASALVAEEELHLAERSLQLEERVRQFIRDKRSLGDATDFDASLVELEYASALQGREFASGELERARQELNTLLGIPPRSDVTLAAGDAWREPGLAELDPVRLESLQLEHRPEIAAARSAYEQAEQRLRLATLASWPWLSLGLRYERDAGSGTSSITKLGGAVGLDLPIFDDHRGEIATLEADRARLREVFRAEVYLGQTELNDALRNLRAQLRLLRIYRETVQPALDENARLTEAGVELGNFNLVQLIAMQDKALRTRRESLAAQLELRSAVFELERSLGMRLSDLEQGKE